MKPAFRKGTFVSRIENKLHLSNMNWDYLNYLAPSENTSTPKPEHNPDLNCPIYTEPSGVVSWPTPFLWPLESHSPMYSLPSAYLNDP